MFFNIGGDPMSDAVRFWCKFIASSSQRSDDEMFGDAAQSLIKTQTHFEPGSSVDSLVDLVSHHAGGADKVNEDEIRPALEKEMLRWIAPKLAALIDSDEKVNAFLAAIAAASKDGEGFKRAVRVTFRVPTPVPPLQQTQDAGVVVVKQEEQEEPISDVAPTVNLVSSPALARDERPRSLSAHISRQSSRVPAHPSPLASCPTVAREMRPQSPSTHISRQSSRVPTHPSSLIQDQTLAGHHLGENRPAVPVEAEARVEESKQLQKDFDESRAIRVAAQGRAANAAAQHQAEAEQLRILHSNQPLSEHAQPSPELSGLGDVEMRPNLSPAMPLNQMEDWSTKVVEPQPPTYDHHKTPIRPQKENIPPPGIKPPLSILTQEYCAPKEPPPTTPQTFSNPVKPISDAMPKATVHLALTTTPLSSVASPAPKNRTVPCRPDFASPRVIDAGILDNRKRPQHVNKTPLAHESKRRRSPSPPACSAKRHNTYPDHHDDSVRGPDRRASETHHRQSSSLFVRPEPNSPILTKQQQSYTPESELARETHPLPSRPSNGIDRSSWSLADRISGWDCPEWCLCKKYNPDGTTTLVDRDMVS
jgi:hypothetical protein